MALDRRWPDALIVLSLCIMIFTLPFSKSMVEICFIACLIFWVLKRLLSYGTPTLASVNLLFKPVLTDLNLPIYLFILAGMFSMSAGVSISLSFEGFFLKLLENVILFFIIVESINDRKRINIILVAMLSSVALISCDGIFQFLSGRDFLRGYIFNGKIRASFSNSNGLGGYITAVIPIVLSIGLMVKNGWSRLHVKILAWVLISVLMFCLILTYSRGAWIASIMSIILFSALKSRRFFVITVIVLIFLLFILPNSAKIHANSIGRISDFSRVSLWQEAVAIIEDFPVFGTGLNTYSLVAPHYKIGEQGGTYPHNSYLQMAAETGLVGLAAFLWIIFRLAKTSLGKLKNIKDKFYNYIIKGLIAGLFGFLIHSFFDVNFYSFQLVILMWFIMGLSVAIQRVALNS